MKRIIDELTLSHIAAVDNPCQEGAMVRVIKRRPDQPAERVAVAKAAPAAQSSGTVDASIAKIMERDGCSKASAMEKAAWEAPALVEASRSSPVEKTRPHFELDESFASPVRKAAVAKFSELAEQIAARGRLAKHVALNRARVAYPQEFAAAYG